MSLVSKREKSHAGGCSWIFKQVSQFQHLIKLHRNVNKRKKKRVGPLIFGDEAYNSSSLAFSRHGRLSPGGPLPIDRRRDYSHPVRLYTHTGHPPRGCVCVHTAQFQRTKVCSWPALSALFDPAGGIAAASKRSHRLRFSVVVHHLFTFDDRPAIILPSSSSSLLARCRPRQSFHSLS